MWASIAAGLRRRPLPAQFHAAAALATCLRDHRAALAVGEPSVGKTMIALTAAALLLASRVLVLAPAHLLGKWTREIRETIPHVQAIELRRLADIDHTLAIPWLRDRSPRSPEFGQIPRNQVEDRGRRSGRYAPTCRVCRAPMPVQ